jgi:hypothetical protein
MGTRTSAVAVLSFCAIGFALCLGVMQTSARGAIARQSNAQQTSEQQAKTFAGVIVSLNGALFILRDEANETWYHLDDQKTAGKFQGKKVAITGTLDDRNDMIHIQTIKEAKG